MIRPTTFSNRLKMVTIRCCVRTLRPSHILAALLWLLFIGLATQEWRKFREEPTFTMVELEPAELPAFTVCPGIHSNFTMVRKSLSSYQKHLWKYIDKTRYENVSFRQIYVDHSLPIGKVLGKQYKQIEDTNSSQDHDVVYKSRRGQWMRTFLMSGTCYTYQPRGRQFNPITPFLGPILRLREFPEFTQRSTNITYVLRFHGAEKPFKDYRFFPDKDIPRVVIRSGDAIQINVRVNRYRNPNLRRKPCNETYGYTVSKCLSHCRYQKQVDRLGCAMPWMDINTKSCIFRKPLNSITTKSAAIIRFQCLPACLDDQLDVTAGVSPLKKRKGRSFVIIKFGYLVDTRITTLSYSSERLLSSIGGYIGLLLGTSILSLIVSGLTAVRNLYQQNK